MGGEWGGSCFSFRDSSSTFGMLHKSINDITLQTSQAGIYCTLKMEVSREKVKGILPGVFIWGWIVLSREPLWAILNGNCYDLIVEQLDHRSKKTAELSECKVI